jgi:hypothetical protein
MQGLGQGRIGRHAPAELPDLQRPDDQKHQAPAQAGEENSTEEKEGRTKLVMDENGIGGLAPEWALFFCLLKTIETRNQTKTKVNKEIWKCSLERHCIYCVK